MTTEAETHRPRGDHHVLGKGKDPRSTVLGVVGQGHLSIGMNGMLRFQRPSTSSHDYFERKYKCHSSDVNTRATILVRILILTNLIKTLVILEKNPTRHNVAIA